MKTIKRFKGLYRFLSNFYPSPIHIGEEMYPTSEHLYQAMKTKNKKTKEKIRLCKTPGNAKKLGRIIPLRKDWEKIKDKVMYFVVESKFLENKKLEKQLLATGKKKLVEGNYWHDNYWGDCYCPKCKHIKGQNKLGKILMRVRKQI